MLSAAGRSVCRNPLWWILTAAAALAVFKCWAGLRFDDSALLAQGGYSAGGLLLFLASWPWFSVYGFPCNRSSTYTFRTTLMPHLLIFTALFGTGLALLWKAALIRPGEGTARAAGLPAPAVVILLILAHLVLFYAANASQRRQKSLALSALALNFRIDTVLLAGVFAASAAARYGYPLPGILCTAVISILILIRALEPVFRVLPGRDSETEPPAPPGIVLAPIRERAAGVNGVAGVFGVRARLESGRISLWLDIGIADGIAPDQLKQLGDAVSRAVTEEYREVSAVNTRSVPLSLGRTLLLKSKHG